MAYSAACVAVADIVSIEPSAIPANSLFISVLLGVSGPRPQHADESGVTIDEMVLECAQNVQCNEGQQSHCQPVMYSACAISLPRQSGDQCTFWAHSNTISSIVTP